LGNPWRSSGTLSEDGPAAGAGKRECEKVRDIVTGILEDSESRWEDALREISEKFDKWNPPAFRLSEQEIESCLSQLSRQNIDDIKLAQAQVCNFAQAQRSALQDVEVPGQPPSRSESYRFG
jgi:sulfopropanediol 3-dehydrogenase